jgi:hypothetical protein
MRQPSCTLRDEHGGQDGGVNQAAVARPWAKRHASDVTKPAIDLSDQVGSKMTTQP